MRKRITSCRTISDPIDFHQKKEKATVQCNVDKMIHTVLFHLFIKDRTDS